MGTAILAGKSSGFPIDKWLASFSIPTLFIQKTFDPAIGAKQLKEALELNKVNNYQLEEIPGSDHHYKNFNLLSKLIQEFI